MYSLMLFYLRWVAFWRLPESDDMRRVRTQSHLRRVNLLRPVWLIAVLVLSVFGQVAVLIGGLLFMTFLSFMFLDEAVQPVPVKVEQRSEQKD